MKILPPKLYCRQWEMKALSTSESTYNEDEVTLYWLVVATPKYRKERGDKIKAEREDRKRSGQEGWGWKTWRRMVEDYIVTMFMFIFQWNIELRRVACCLSFDLSWCTGKSVEQTVSVPTTVILRHITYHHNNNTRYRHCSLSNARKGQGHKAQMSVLTDLLVLVTVCFITRGTQWLSPDGLSWWL